MRAVLLSAILAPALAYFREAQAVTGEVVKGAGNLTMGGKIGTYTVLLQVLNPGMGDLTLLMECCGSARYMAGDAAAKVNTNQFTGKGSEPEDKIKAEYVGEGKCSVPGPLDTLTRQGNITCDYLYTFKNKNWRQYQYTSMCVSSDVCAQDVVGSTKGTKLLYTVVLQILNKNAGDLVYAGEGPIGQCLEGMNTVNEANLSAFNKEVPNYMDLFGTKIQLGTKKVMDVKGMTQLQPLEMLSQCKNTSSTGVLYIFKNKFWNKEQSYMNISKYQTDSYNAEMATAYKELMDYHVPGQKKEKPEKDKTPKKSKKDEGDEIGEAIGGILGSIFGGDDDKGKGKAAKGGKGKDDDGDDVGEAIGNVLGAVFGGDDQGDDGKKGGKKGGKDDGDDLGEAVGGILGEIFGGDKDDEAKNGKAGSKASSAPAEAEGAEGKKQDKGGLGLLDGIGSILEQLGEEAQKGKKGGHHKHQKAAEAESTEETSTEEVPSQESMEAIKFKNTIGKQLLPG